MLFANLESNFTKQTYCRSQTGKATESEWKNSLAFGCSNCGLWSLRSTLGGIEWHREVPSRRKHGGWTVSCLLRTSRALVTYCVTKSRTSSWNKVRKKCKTLETLNRKSTYILDLTRGKIGKAVSKVPASFGPGSAPTLSGPTALLDARWTTEGSETSRPAARRSFESFPLKAWHCGMPHMPHMPHMPLSFNIFNLQQLETTITQSIVLYNSRHSVNSRGSALYIYMWKKNGKGWKSGRSKARTD